MGRFRIDSSFRWNDGRDCHSGLDPESTWFHTPFMAEYESSPEQGPSDEEVVAALREHGTTKETEALLLTWTLAREAEVEAENSSRATLVFNIRRAKLYESAGLVEAALENFQDALVQAEQENEADAVAECVEGIARLSTS